MATPPSGAAPSTASAPTTRASTRRPSWGPRDSPASRLPARRPRARPWQTLGALLLPTNVQMANVEVWGPAAARLIPAGERAAARQQSIDSAAALLSKSRRPVIVAGLGAHRAGAKEALQALAEKIGALLMTSARGKDMFHGHPYNLGIL